MTPNCQGSPSDLLSLEKTGRVFGATKASVFQAFLQRTGTWGNVAASFPLGDLAPYPFSSGALDRGEKPLPSEYLGTIYNRLLGRESGFSAQPLKKSCSYSLLSPCVVGWGLPADLASRRVGWGRAGQWLQGRGLPQSGAWLGPRGVAWGRKGVAGPESQPWGLGAGRRLLGGWRRREAATSSRSAKLGPCWASPWRKLRSSRRGKVLEAWAAAGALGLVGRVGSHAGSPRGGWRLSSAPSSLQGAPEVLKRTAPWPRAAAFPPKLQEAARPWVIGWARSWRLAWAWRCLVAPNC